MKAEDFLLSTDAALVRRLGTFTFDGMNSRDYHIILTEPPSRVLPERDVTVVPVSGRNGDLVMDNGRYKNFTLTYKCAIVPTKLTTLRSAVIIAADMLKSTAEYMRLEEPFDNTYYRLARIKNEITVGSLLEEGGKFEIKFDCKPQRFFRSGDTEHSFLQSGLYIGGMAPYPALPLITVYGNGAGNVTIGGTTIKILDMEGMLVLDCELSDAYRVEVDGSITNCNGQVNAQKFPVLYMGDHLVEFDGGVTGLSIKPRWWTR